MGSLVFSRGFGGGIISPDMFGRIDDAKFNIGVKQARNMLVLPQGPATSRPGTKFVRAAKHADRKVRMLPFRYSSTQTMALELGHAYIRFHSYGGTLLTPTTGVPAWDSGATYSHGDLVTHDSSTWYATQDVPLNKRPDLFEQTAEPDIAYTWVETEPASTTVPSGYTYVGSELPTTATNGEMVYITTTGYEIINYVEECFGGEGGEPYCISTPVYGEVTYYTGYTGTATGYAADYWYKIPSAAYEIPSPYDEADLMQLRFVQSGDVLTITHKNYPPRELRRLGSTTWVMTPIAFQSSLEAPTGGSAVATIPSGAAGPNVLYKYVVTRVSDNGLDESLPSAIYSCSNQLFDTGAYNTVSTGSVERCNVYKLSGGFFGFIGQTDAGSIIDDNIAADTSKTPPSAQDPFATDWPMAVSYFEQRRMFANTTLYPQGVWATKGGTESNLDFSIPPRANDAVSFSIAAREAAEIQHMVPMDDLILLTQAGEWKTAAGLEPLSINAKPQSGVGCGHVAPQLVGNDILFAAARGGHIHALGYSFDVQAYTPTDLSIRATELFDFRTILDMAQVKAPTPIVWCVSSAGNLLGLTFVAKEQVIAWHTHDTEGVFESICAVPEGDEDILYCTVKRTINENTVRYVECFAPRFFQDREDAFFVDCGVTYSGAAATTISGLDHLEGKTVSILADGAVVPSRTVSGGEIELDTAASLVHIGLGFTADLETLPVAAEDVEGYAQSSTKTINHASVRLTRSGTFLAGPSSDKLTEYPGREFEELGSPPALKTGVYDLSIDGDWNDEGTILLRCVDPLPFTVASLTLDIAFGG